jgi:ABC-type transport system involved in multi-copper enzyme maturation permease subunit
MSFRWGPGPVFHYEWVTSSRRWQMYAGRSLFVLLLLAALFTVWYTDANQYSSATGLSGYRKILAEMGEKFFYAVVGTQLTLVLLVAPALTTGAVCVDKTRGTLLHLLTTDLTNAEIILGKLATRLVTLFNLVLCTFPVLFLCTLEGGIDPDALIGAFLITLGVAIFTGTLALTLSVWCRKTYEVLLAVYMIVFLLLIVNPLLRFWGLKVTPPFWIEALNFYWVAFAPYMVPGAITLADDCAFLAGCALAAVIFVLAAVWRVRAVAIRQSSQVTKPRGRWLRFLDLGRLTWWLPGFGLDFSPVLWREWHRKRPSRWVRAVWTVYVTLALIFTGTAIWQYFATTNRTELTPFVNAFQVALGLLLVSVGSVTALSEERVRGTMDLLLTTTIPTWKIVWGKWGGVYRTVILLSLLPGMLMFALACGNDFWPAVQVMVGLVLAYGAAVTSFGLALATWNRRPGRALALSVIVYVAITAGWFLIVFLLLRWSFSDTAQGLAIGSPWYGSGLLAADMESQRITRASLQNPFAFSHLGWAILWTVLYTLAAAVLLALTLATFNASLGRMPYYPGPVHEAVRPARARAARARPAAARLVRRQ